MKVKIGDKVYDGKEEPVMIILNKGEREQIANMHHGCTRYCMYPEDKFTVEQIKEWMLDPPKENCEKKL
jgi:hypothetical protein